MVPNDPLGDGITECEKSVMGIDALAGLVGRR